MDKYLITKFIAKFGYYLSIVTVVIGAIGGFAASKISGLFIGAFFGAFMCVPLMMYCEMCMAVIKTEENTRNKDHHHQIKHAA